MMNFYKAKAWLFLTVVWIARDTRGVPKRSLLNSTACIHIQDWLQAGSNRNAGLPKTAAEKPWPSVLLSCTWKNWMSSWAPSWTQTVRGGDRACSWINWSWQRALHCVPFLKNSRSFLPRIFYPAWSSANNFIFKIQPPSTGLSQGQIHPQDEGKK